jgi:SAM-dependent methyltransferase
MFDEEAWEQRYRSQATIWSREPNPQLVTEVADLVAGTALDAGSGEGTDACWLAARGWRVTAVDFASTALQRAAARVETLGPDVAGRVELVQADLTTWTPPEGHFDLVSAQFVHLPAEPWLALVARLAAAVTPGGDLLVVGHHPSDMETTMPRPPMPELYFTAEQVADGLARDQWDVLAADARPRAASDPEGRRVTIHDTVLRARRRRGSAS